MSKLLPIDVLRSMQHSTLDNYIVPGLASSLLGGEGNGSLRMFEMLREQHNEIVPHSHRFDFTCLVLGGRVINRIWHPSAKSDNGEMYQSTQLKYKGKPGEYDQEPLGEASWSYIDNIYSSGDWYSMRAEQVHSIKFALGSVVLFFEGPAITDSTYILQPIVNKIVVPTFKVEPWMFQRRNPKGDTP